MSDEEKFFRIPYQRISRDDIRQRLGKDKVQLLDMVLSDEFMQEVANRMGSALVDEGWWEILSEAVKSVSDLFNTFRQAALREFE
jgi:hypothetical protein